ncbi:MAG TPA: cupin domain-containing protein [Terriglobales bacterium]|nr:cupin domain-containing protein [Terriglobales bacterium]
MAYVVNKSDLPSGDTFEGYLHNAAHVSFFLSETPPGRGPRLHTHPYEEVFIVQAGTLTFTVGTETVEVSGEKIVVVPAGTPHKFINSGTEIARHIDLHVNERMVTEWLENKH